MSAVREMPGIRLVRPLLGVAKARLVALLTAERQPFFSDPSNRNPVFERARLRVDASADDQLVDRVTVELRDFGRQRIERERELNRLLASAVSLHPAGFAVLDPAAIRCVEAELSERLLGRIAASIGGACYPLRRERVARLRAGLLDRRERARTLGGCRFVPWRGRLLVLRELAAAAPALPLEPGAELIWDRRFLARVISYLGQTGPLGDYAPFADRSNCDLPRLLHSVLPALWDEAGIVAVPHLGYLRPRASPLPKVAFRPLNPLSHAGFTVV